jgi:hypothetical protein
MTTNAAEFLYALRPAVSVLFPACLRMSWAEWGRIAEAIHEQVWTYRMVVDFSKGIVRFEVRIRKTSSHADFEVGTSLFRQGQEACLFSKASRPCLGALRSCYSVRTVGCLPGGTVTPIGIEDTVKNEGSWNGGGSWCRISTYTVGTD